MKIVKKINFMLNVTLNWTISYALSKIKKRHKPLHIFFCLVDHFEPGTGGVEPSIEEQRMCELIYGYPKLAARHRDSFGNIPKRTWFFPPHYHRRNNLKRLVTLCKNGFGEIELHLHHGKTFPDTSENLKKTLEQCIEEYSKFGIFGTENGNKRYGFIHGDWALDNSRNNNFCGVNNEIEILSSTGCYADFTFPSPCESNPKQINSIFYATDDPNRPKSHDNGMPVKVGGQKNGHLMIIQGPLHPFCFQNKFLGFRTPSDSIHHHVSNMTLDFWIKTAIHVEGKSDWIFVKTHTHGATASGIVLSAPMDNIFYHLEKKYNDENNYILHYVTARELYNIIKAAEAGESGNPEQYRNYILSKPSYDDSHNISGASETLNQLAFKTYREKLNFPRL